MRFVLIEFSDDVIEVELCCGWRMVVNELWTGLCFF